MAFILIIGTFVTVLGYLITFRNNLDLIAGDPDVIHTLGNKARYLAGIASLLIGTLLNSYALFGYLDMPVWQGASLMLIFVVALIATIVFLFFFKPIQR